MFEKIKSVFKSGKFKKALAVGMSIACLGMTMVPLASANEVQTGVVQITPDEAIAAASGLFGQVTQVVNFTNIAKVLAIGLGAVLGIWLAWWGLRKLVRMIIKVLEKGRISL